MVEATYAEPLPQDAVVIGHGVAYSWGYCQAEDPDVHEHTNLCLFVWHDCGEILGPDTIAPGQRYGWRPAGAGLHLMTSRNPLTLTPSLFWNECCGVHGFVQDGAWRAV